MIKVTTKTGFEAEVNEGKILDFRFLEKSVETVKGKDDLEKMDATVQMLKMLFTKADKERFLQHVADHNDGIADISAVMNEFTEILDQCKEANQKVKN
jgi:hypothetical protein|nr:MAG TPA_asm: hypothetical protein [Caudoviricetes sp.]